MTYYGAQSIHADEGMTIPNCDVESSVINNTAEQRNGRNNLISISLLSLQGNVQGLFSISPLPDAAGALGCSSAHVKHTCTNRAVAAHGRFVPPICAAQSDSLEVTGTQSQVNPSGSPEAKCRH